MVSALRTDVENTLATQAKYSYGVDRKSWEHRRPILFSALMIRLVQLGTGNPARSVIPDNRNFDTEHFYFILFECV